MWQVFGFWLINFSIQCWSGDTIAKTRLSLVSLSSNDGNGDENPTWEMVAIL